MSATTQDAVLGALSIQLGLPGIRINALPWTPRPSARFPKGRATSRRLPHLQGRDHADDRRRRHATGSRGDRRSRFASGCEIRTVVALEDEIANALDRYYQTDGIPHQLAQEAEEVIVETPFVDRRAGADRRQGRGGGRRATDLVYENPDKFDEAAERSAVTILDRVLARAAGEGASDIHLESTLDSFRVRFRVDGTFREIATFAPQLAAPVVARLKVLSGMDIAEHRLPQDGRFSATVGTRRLDLRAPLTRRCYGEKAVLRLLDRSTLRLHLETMGMRGKVLEQFRNLIRRPEAHDSRHRTDGQREDIHALCEPRRAGGNREAHHHNRGSRRVRAVRRQPGTDQREGGLHIRARAPRLSSGRTPTSSRWSARFATRKRCPTAVEASLTGHLVFSTLHTNSAVATVARVVDMGLEPYLLSSCLVGIVAQRSCGSICPTCRTRDADPSGVAHLFPGGAPETLHRGKGCQDCRGTGYRAASRSTELMAMNGSCGT